MDFKVKGDISKPRISVRKLGGGWRWWGTAGWDVTRYLQATREERQGSESEADILSPQGQPSFLAKSDKEEAKLWGQT